MLIYNFSYAKQLRIIEPKNFEHNNAFLVSVDKLCMNPVLLDCNFAKILIDQSLNLNILPVAPAQKSNFKFTISSGSLPANEFYKVSNSVRLLEIELGTWLFPKFKTSYNIANRSISLVLPLQYC
jgi:hypothetical protein